MEFGSSTHDGNIREEYSRIMDHYINLLTTVNTLQSQLTTTQTQINRRIQNVTTTLRWLPNYTQNRPPGLNGLFNTSLDTTLPSNRPNSLRNNRTSTVNENTASSVNNSINDGINTPSRRRRRRNNSTSIESSLRSSNARTTNRQSSNSPRTIRRDTTLNPIIENTVSNNNDDVTNNLFRNMIVEIQNINGDQSNQQNPINDLLTAMLSNDITRNDASMNDLFNTSNTEQNANQSTLTGNLPSPFPQFRPFQNIEQPTTDNTTPQVRNSGFSTNIFTTGQPFTTTLMSPSLGGGIFGGSTNLFENVPVFPSAEQIDNATRTVTFQQIESPMNHTCPITMETFEPTQIVMQITHCGHIFNPTHLHSWFRTHVKCPVCRHDIRESRENQETGRQDVNNSNNGVTENISSPIPLVDIEQPLSSLGNREGVSRQTQNNEHTPYRPGRVSLLSLANAASRSPPILSSQLTPVSSNNDIVNNTQPSNTEPFVRDNSGNESSTQTYTFNPPITTFNTTTAQNGVSVVSQGRIIHTDNRLGELTALSNITESILRSMITEIDISGNPIQNQTNVTTSINTQQQPLDISNNLQQNNSTDISGGTMINGSFVSQDILDSLGYMSQD